jgi:glycosyltransferase involved in cell wall biosynthesis
MQDSAAELTTRAPLISVITATYNWSSVLRYAIQSVLWQTLQDFEMLIISDGCTDDSVIGQS